MFGTLSALKVSENDRTETRQFSVFDLDRTLTRRGTYTPFLLHCAWTAAPWRLAFVPLVIIAMLVYKLGLIDRARLKTVMQHLLLGASIDRDAVHDLTRSFAQRCVMRGCYEEAFVQIARERAEGREVVLATAAHRFYAEAIADQLSITHVVATESLWDGDRLTTAIVGANCYGAAKRDRIATFLAVHGVLRAQAHVRFFSDDASDLPTFDWADQPVAVNPSVRLAAIAGARDWPTWRWGRSDGAAGVTALPQLATA